MKKQLLWLVILGMVIAAACNGGNEPTETEQDITDDNVAEEENSVPENNEPEENEGEEEGNQPVVSETDAGDFMLRLVSEKAIYDPEEEVQLKGKLKYIGEAEELEIIHQESPFNFEMIEINRGAELPYPLKEIEQTSTLEQKQWYEEEYIKRIAYSLDDEHADFYQAFMNETGFPPGEYEIELRTDFAVTVEEVPENHTYTTSIVIEVRE
ncbi:hypothetical protein K8O68_14375 [Salipaludibacillus sp. CUR1]|uniref:hypothetical protein n=1 Tax=Salipaludibacillus sp. CUR1 TaxID=2820003 RepID=UPI001E4CDA3C|nr:hypothetical protein [Salipaludibacillus sp. CUR1]MCE7793607.1 hypothetical protein [Salipaludibacillus sp. CUR1]